MAHPNDRTIVAEFPAKRQMLDDVALPMLLEHVVKGALEHVKVAVEGRPFAIRGLKLVTGQSNDDYLRGDESITIQVSIDIRLERVKEE